MSATKGRTFAMSNIVDISTISGNLSRRPLEVMAEALSLRGIDLELAADLAGDVMLALRMEGMKVVTDVPALLGRRRSRPPL
jgi:hypothetical protein